MPRIAIPFVGQSYAAHSLKINAQRCVNFYLEPGGPDSPTQAALVGTPGLTRLVTLPNAPAPIRGIQQFKGMLVVVSGGLVYSVDKDWVVAERGSLQTDEGPVSFTASTTQLLIVDGAAGYVYDGPTNVFARILDTEFPNGAKRVSYLDGRAIVESPNSEQFSESSQGDFRQWNGLDFYSAEGAPDNIVAHVVDHRELWLFGESTTEIFVNSSAGLTRNGNAFIEAGCAAAFSVAKLDNSIIWLGRDERGQGTVWRAQDYRPVRISTFALDTAIAAYSRIDDAIAYAYQQEGHLFYVLTFPTAMKTWAFDVATNQWAERMYFNSQLGREERHRSNCHEFFNGKHVVGDYQNGRLYALDLENYTDDGDILLSIRSSPTVSDDNRLVTYGSLEVNIKAGVGLPTGQGSDPVMMLRYSNDAGETWSNRREATMGKIGQSNARAKWNRLGQGRNRVFEVSISDPVKRVITAAYCEVN